MQAARDNVKDPPGIFVKVGVETMRGALKFIEEDLPRAFSSVDDLHLLGDLADAQTEASHAVGAYIEYLETEVAPRSRASFRLGSDKFEQKVRLEEGITLPLDRLLAIATRELKETQEAFERCRTDERRRSARDVGEHEIGASRARRAGRCRARAVGRAREPTSNDSRSSRCHRVNRSPSRRRPTSIAGHLRACGRPGRSRANRRARTTI